MQRWFERGGWVGLALCSNNSGGDIAVSVTAKKNGECSKQLEHESVPGGAAIARYNCDKVDAACLHVCGF